MDLKKQISVLDLSAPESLNIVAAAEKFKQATTECGFIYVRFDPKNFNIIEAVRREQRRFFGQSVAQKNAVAIDANNRGYLGLGEALMDGAKRPDQKEVFFWGREVGANDPDYLAGVPLCGPNQWPANSTEFKTAIEQYSHFVEGIGSVLLEIIATALGQSRDYFKPFYERTMHRGQLLRYPPTDNHPDQFGVAAHSDFGCITLLLQETAGLEVQFPDGQWVAAPPMENTLVVNIGDLLERWSNLRLPSTKHRVRNISEDARYSIAMFYDPSPRAVVDPADLQLEEGLGFEPIEAAEYILSKNKKAFAHYK